MRQQNQLPILSLPILADGDIDDDYVKPITLNLQVFMVNNEFKSEKLTDLVTQTNMQSCVGLGEWKLLPSSLSFHRESTLSKGTTFLKVHIQSTINLCGASCHSSRSSCNSCSTRLILVVVVGCVGQTFKSTIKVSYDLTR